jgi:hypothetical protein
LTRPARLRCTVVDPDTDGSSAAAETSRNARAWRTAASALVTLVLACIALIDELREQRVVEALPPLHERRRAVLRRHVGDRPVGRDLERDVRGALLRHRRAPVQRQKHGGDGREPRASTAFRRVRTK